VSNAKISIRFFDDREVRAMWDEENAKWWFSVLDIVAVLTDQDDYTKTRNYWKYLKARLKKENSQVVSATTQLKILAPDGKKRLADVLDYKGIIYLTDYMNAMMLSPTNSEVLKSLLGNAPITKINDREMFMKGIDYSYYYEENSE
jgi:hypothetical protein